MKCGYSLVFTQVGTVRNFEIVYRNINIAGICASKNYAKIQNTILNNYEFIIYSRLTIASYTYEER
jgi:hypothetical protein